MVGDHWSTKGNRSTFLQNWIEIDEEYDSDIEERRRLLAEQRDVVIRSLPEVISWIFKSTSADSVLKTLAQGLGV